MEMEDQGENKMSDQLSLPSQPGPSNLRESEDDNASAGDGAGSEEVECPKTTARREELIREIGRAMDTTLKQLEYLNSKNSASIFVAAEELTKNFSVIHEDLLVMEGRLARNKNGYLGLDDIARARVAVANFHKLVKRFHCVYETVYVIESAPTKVRILTEPMEEEYKNELKQVITAAVGEDSPYYKTFYPLASRFLEVYRELSRRTIEWSEEFCRRLSTEKDKVPDEELQIQ